MNFWKKTGLICALFIFPTTAFSFSDITPEDPQNETFLRLQDLGIMGSDTAGNINPHRVPTKAEAIAIALRTAGIPVSQEFNGNTYFSDVNPNEWYAPIIATAVERRVIITKSNTINPDAAITKAEYLAYLFRATRVNFTKYFAQTKNIADDVSEDAWFAPHFAYAKQYQIAHLPGDNLYQPLKVLTRREIAMITERQLRIYHGDENTANFVELQARMNQFITLLQADNYEDAQTHLHRIVELTQILARTNNNKDVIASQAIALSMGHFTDGLQSIKQNQSLNALENFHLAAQQAQRAGENSESMKPFANDLNSVINQTIDTFYSVQGSYAG